MIEYSAGVILYKFIENIPYYLVSKSESGHFGFAKGHIEKDETPIMAAIREVKEEVGVTLENIDKSNFFESEYEMPNGNIKNVKYYISNFDKQVGGSQEAYLLKFDEAYEKLTYETDKQYLLTVNYLLEKISSNK